MIQQIDNRIIVVVNPSCSFKVWLTTPCSSDGLSMALRVSFVVGCFRGGNSEQIRQEKEEENKRSCPC